MISLYNMFVESTHFNDIIFIVHTIMYYNNVIRIKFGN